MQNHLSWNESETYCKSYGGHLAALTTSEEFSFAKNICPHNNGGCWVGGRGINATLGLNWKWSDNTSYWNDSIINRVAILSSCSSLSCHANASFDLCTLISNGSAALSAERCPMSHSFICMVEVGRCIMV